MPQKNNHARTKEKRKKLRLKNFFRRVQMKRLEKIAKAKEPKGQTIYGPARSHAIHISELFPEGTWSWNSGNHHPFKLNQRQRRKRRRWSPHFKG